ncbi:MAG: hypothetical protein M3Y81_00930 [Chloroflexota bacterium]|nr:hypothetical protein [Chloroflexota bacterium]
MISGTIRDSISVLEALLEQEKGHRRPLSSSSEKLFQVSLTHSEVSSSFGLDSYSNFRMVGDGVALTAANPKLDVKVSLHPAFLP